MDACNLLLGRICLKRFIKFKEEEEMEGTDYDQDNVQNGTEKRYKEAICTCQWIYLCQ